MLSPSASTVKGYPCTMCNIELNSVEQYQAHISGAKHKNQYVYHHAQPTNKSCQVLSCLTNLDVNMRIV